MDTIEKLNLKDCTGCSACMQKCPKSAIKMVENEEGFLYPVIDKKKCINCGLCKITCPILNYKINKNKVPKAYAIKNKDLSSLLKSSSGGFFSIVTNYILKQKGYIYGASFDRDFTLNHIQVSNANELEKLRGSKYLQSNINMTFKNIKDKLDADNYVLFVGTPCQVAGLKSFLKKDYLKLITCDLICHGVPSQELFKKYIEYLENKYNKKIKNYEFRNKEKKGWSLTAKVTFDDNSYKYISSDFDPYYSSFLNCETYRESCYNCKFSNLNREGDFTLGDYWGVAGIHNKFYDENGVSLVLVNTEKANKLFDDLKSDFDYLETDINYAINKNKNLVTPSNRPIERDNIYDVLFDGNFNKHLKVKVNLKKIMKSIIPNKLKKIIIKMKGIF